MIDGADNNDAFQGASAVNQGGVAGIAGTLPAHRSSGPVLGRPPTAQRGDGPQWRRYRQRRHEIGHQQYFTAAPSISTAMNYLAANTPLAAAGSGVRRIRNQQGGFSFGGPIRKNKTFYFLTGEYQLADASNATSITTLSPAWVSQGLGILSTFGIVQKPCHGESD